MGALIAIDPGIAGTGHAVFINGNLRSYGNTYAKVGLPWYDKADIITRQLEDLLSEYPCHGTIVVCEFPTYMAGKSVASKSDSLVKMAYLAGQLARAAHPMEFDLVVPTKWKGTMSKALVERRIRKIIPKLPKGAKDHALDAIGIGLWKLKGKL